MTVSRLEKLRQFSYLLFRNPLEAVDRVSALMSVGSDPFLHGRPCYRIVELDSVMCYVSSLSPDSAKSINDELHDVEDSVRSTMESVAGQSPIARAHNADSALARICYTTVRCLKPKLVLETGVAYGITSSFILHGMEANGFGRLCSVDLPPLGREVDRHVGTAIPLGLRSRWQLIRGVSKRVLPRILPQLGSLDMFVHDSLHTYRNIAFELRWIAPYLGAEAAVIADDIQNNRAFLEWSSVSKPRYSAVVAQESKDSLFGVAIFLGREHQRASSVRPGSSGSAGACRDSNPL